MERAGSKHGPRLDEQLEHEAEAIERSGRESRAEEERLKERDEDPSGHRISGSGTSADEYSYKDHGETGGASHPKPRSNE